MTTVDRQHAPDDFLAGVEQGRKQVAAERITDRLEAEGYIRRRIERAVEVQRRRGRHNAYVACIITALATYNLALHGLSWPWS